MELCSGISRCYQLSHSGAILIRTKPDRIKSDKCPCHWTYISSDSITPSFIDVDWAYTLNRSGMYIDVDWAYTLNRSGMCNCKITVNDLHGWPCYCQCAHNSSDLQRQKAVTAYLKSKQLLPFGFVHHIWWISWLISNLIPWTCCLDKYIIVFLIYGIRYYYIHC